MTEVLRSHIAPTKGATLGAKSPAAASVSSVEATSTFASGMLAGIYSAAHPSDGGIAVGPQHVLQVVNRAFGIFAKDGTPILTGALTDLLGVVAGTYLTDPRVLYDAQSGRWVVIALQNDRTTLTSDLFWAVSRTSDPTGSYCYYSSDQTTGSTFTSVAADFPGLGFDQYNFYITLQRFSWYAGYVADSKVIMVPRAPILSCGSGFSAPAWRVNTTLPGDFDPPVLQPTQTFTSTGGEYLVGSQSLGGSYVGVWQLSNVASPSVVTLSFVGPRAVTPYRVPRPATQAGTNIPVNFSDARVSSSAVLRNNSLYFAFTVGGAAPGTNDVRWYELSAAGLTVVQEGELGFSSGSYGFPAVMVDAAGGLTLSAAVAGVNYPLGAVVASRLPSDPPNQLSRPRIWTPSTATAYTDPVAYSTSLGVRWGDYFGIALDTDGTQIWTEASYPTSAVSWGTVMAVSRATTSVGPTKYVLTVDNPTPTGGMAVRVRAQLTSSGGTPVAEAGHAVTWTASPPGTFSASQSLTDATGVATITFTTAATAPVTYVVTGTDEFGLTGSTAPFTTTSRVLTNTVYLPNVTKTLGGPDGWTTPFIVQNVGAAPTSLDVSFYRFSDGALIAQRTVPLLSPGTSFADVPTNDNDLPADTQFSVVVRSYGSQVVAVVNEVQGTGAQFQAMSYTGVSAGATSAYLPNVTRRFYGWDVPFIVQNIDVANASATATFTAIPSPSCAVTHSYARALTIDPGRSKAIDPNFEPAYSGAAGSGLLDGCQYSVVVMSAKQIAVVANATVSGAASAAYSHNALTVGAATLCAPYAALNGPGGRTSPIVVQNTGIAPTVPTLEFTPLGGGTPRGVTLPSLAPGASFAFDPRFTNGDVTKPLCTSATATCLANGEYSVRITAGGTIAAVVLPTSATTAAAYSAALAGQPKSYLPNVTRTLGGPSGWTTPIALQSTSATAVTLKWYRFTDGTLVTTQNLTLTPMSTKWIDPRGVSGLADNTQYAVVADAGVTGTLTAIVYEQSFSGGDGDMIYEGFGAPQ